VSLVLDSSATLAWIYSDETTEAIRRVFQAVANDGAVVPALWRLEIANSLIVAVRRGRIDADFRRAALPQPPDPNTDQRLLWVLGLRAGNARMSSRIMKRLEGNAPRAVDVPSIARRF